MRDAGVHRIAVVDYTWRPGQRGQDPNEHSGQGPVGTSQRAKGTAWRSLTCRNIGEASPHG